MPLPRLLVRAASVALCVAALAATGTARAQRAAAITWEAGGGEGVELWRIGIQRPAHVLAAVGSWVATLAWEAQVGQWGGRTAGRAIPALWDVALTPLVRLEQPAEGRWTAFVEGAVGAHLISRNRVHPLLDMSSAYQFGDHLGLGIRYRGLELVFRHQHLSNASTVQPNPGVNFSMIRIVTYLR